MNETQKGFCLLFLLSLAAAVIYGVLAFVALRRRDQWLRILDACERFGMRLGFSKRAASFGRGFSESRLGAVILALFTVAFVVLAVMNVIGYFHFRDKLN